MDDWAKPGTTIYSVHGSVIAYLCNKDFTDSYMDEIISQMVRVSWQKSVERLLLVGGMMESSQLTDLEERISDIIR